MTYLTPQALAADLALRDLTDPAQGRHAIQLIVDAILSAVSGRWNADLVVHRGARIVDVADNYDRLGYTPDATTRDARYTRHVDGHRVLRSQTSALVPPALRRIATTGRTEVVVACPGIVYRRDTIDRLHTGTPHQLDVWRLTGGAALERADLLQLIEVAIGAALPGTHWRTVPAAHPYTSGGLEIQALAAGGWVEVGECGLAAPHVLAHAGLGPDVSGLALGVGLDRLLMLRKGIDDIRLLRAIEPRIADQLLDLEPWRPVSRLPPIRRDLSIVAEAGVDAESLGDAVRTSLGSRADALESVELLAVTGWADLPPTARHRLGLGRDQVNALVRLTLRPVTATMTDAMANVLRDEVYRAIHIGPVQELADPAR
jgi:phenylalanyl-tRNA synthetase alpha chain